MLRFVFRLSFFLVLVPSFLFGYVDERGRVARMRRYCRYMLRFLGIKPSIARRALADIDHGLLVMNHVSWLDPAIVAVLAPSVFVTSTDVAADPLLGRVCRKAGCVFVNRRRARAVGNEHRELAGLLRRRLVTIFPEATSSCGDSVLPFRPAFFESARLAGVPVHPLVMRYRAIDEHPLTRRSRDHIHWYGDMGFAAHLFYLLLRVRRIDVSIERLPSQAWQADLNRKQMAHRVHDSVCSAYHALGRQPVVAQRRSA